MGFSDGGAKTIWSAEIFNVLLIMDKGVLAWKGKAFLLDPRRSKYLVIGVKAVKSMVKCFEGCSIKIWALSKVTEIWKCRDRAAYRTVLRVRPYKIRVFYGYFTCKPYRKAFFFTLRRYGTGKKTGIRPFYGARRHLKFLKQRIRPFYGARRHLKYLKQ